MVKASFFFFVWFWIDLRLCFKHIDVALIPKLTQDNQYKTETTIK